jgi:hypothetical protein
VGDGHVPFAEGDKVEAEFDGEGWVMGTIVAARPDGSVDVVFDADGHTESYDAASANAELRAALVIPASPTKREKLIDFTAAYNELFKERCLFNNDMTAPPEIEPSSVKVSRFPLSKTFPTLSSSCSGLSHVLCHCTCRKLLSRLCGSWGSSGPIITPNLHPPLYPPPPPPRTARAHTRAHLSAVPKVGQFLEAVDKSKHWFRGKVVGVKRDLVTGEPTRAKVNI